MASVALDRAAPRLVVEATADRRLLRGFLEQDRRLAAYALCDLEDREAGRARWGIARVGEAAVILRRLGHDGHGLVLERLGDRGAVLGELAHPAISGHQPVDGPAEVHSGRPRLAE